MSQSETVEPLLRPKSLKSMQFRLGLDTLIYLSTPIARAIQTLEGAGTSLCDVFVVWTGVGWTYRRSLADPNLESIMPFRQHVVDSYNARFLNMLAEAAVSPVPSKAAAQAKVRAAFLDTYSSVLVVAFFLNPCTSRCSCSGLTSQTTTSSA